MSIQRFLWMLLLCCSGVPHVCRSQETPIGNWQSHFSYNSANSIERIGNRIYAASTHLWYYSLDEGDFTTFSKVNGLSDIKIKFIRYDALSNYMIIVYENGNIDLMQGDNFYNMPDIKNLNITGSKKINAVYFRDKKMYLCSEFGIVVLDPEKREIKETYVLQLNSKVLSIRSLIEYGNYFYAATEEGIYKADVHNPVLQNFANWTRIDTREMNFLFTFKSKLFSASPDSIYQVVNDVPVLKSYTLAPILKIRTGENDFYVCESDDNIRSVKIFNSDAMLVETVGNLNPRDVIETSPNEIWVADIWDGLLRLDNRNVKIPVKPNGIFSNSTYNLTIQNNELFVMAGGEKNWIYTYNGDGFSRLSNGKWIAYNRYNYTPSMDTFLDVMDVVVDPLDQTIYAASFKDGLLELRANNTATIYRNTAFIQPQIGDNSNRIADLVMDQDRNLWMSNYGAPDQLVVKKADGTWQKFSFPYSASEKAASQIVIDDANQKWIVAPRGTGIFVLNDNNTIDNKNDDQVKLLRSGLGYGNLPSNEINCITKDANGKLWVGTNDGIGIFNCAESVMSQSGCDAELKIVKYDLNAGLLFQRENVRTIAVDGANNKWIGTNNGVWLISDDAEKILSRFTIDNSPLPSNEVNRIVVHPQTGDVYIATNAGLVSYRGQATEGSETNDEMKVFPNPVPSQYGGIIAIKGLVGNSDIRITDVNGQLVYRTRALGGTATWNGLNYLGKRPVTGVYFVFVTNEDGSQKRVGKFIFNE